MNETPEHRFRNRLNLLMLQTMSIQEETKSDADYLRQLELIESLQMTVQQLADDLKSQVDPDWLESRVRILVVEDDSNQRNSIVHALRKAGLFVAEASTGAEAVNYLYHAAQPDVVLMDVQMPHCDGLEARRMMDFMPVCGRVKVIAMTAADVSDEDLKSFDGYVRKPFQLPALIETIRSAVATEGADCDENAQQARHK